jgi:hypothetical protein
MQVDDAAFETSKVAKGDIRRRSQAGKQLLSRGLDWLPAWKALQSCTRPFDKSCPAMPRPARSRSLADVAAPLLPPACPPPHHAAPRASRSSGSIPLGRTDTFQFPTTALKTLSQPHCLALLSAQRLKKFSFYFASIHRANSDCLQLFSHPPSIDVSREPLSGPSSAVRGCCPSFRLLGTSSKWTSATQRIDV